MENEEIELLEPIEEKKDNSDIEITKDFKDNKETKIKVEKDYWIIILLTIVIIVILVIMIENKK